MKDNQKKKKKKKKKKILVESKEKDIGRPHNLQQPTY